jgi:hypothetical protein
MHFADPVSGRPFSKDPAVVKFKGRYLFDQGNNDQGRTWYLSVVPIDWNDGIPVLAEHKLPAAAGQSR